VGGFPGAAAHAVGAPRKLSRYWRRVLTAGRAVTLNEIIPAGSIPRKTQTLLRGLGKDQPGDGPVVTAGRAAKRLKTADCIMQALAIAIARLGAAAVVLEFLRFVSGLFRWPTGPVPAPIDQAG